MGVCREFRVCQQRGDMVYDLGMPHASKWSLPCITQSVSIGIIIPGTENELVQASEQACAQHVSTEWYSQT